MNRMVQSALKVMTIVGTRPEIIRLSRTIALLDDAVQHVIVHTNQNYDYELSEIFYKDLELRQPDYCLGVETETIGRMLGTTLIKTEQVMLKERPQAVLILGDTNSSLAGIVAKRYRIPVYHMEAGNRCFDLNVPEEINRKIIDHIADFNLVYTEHARRHLLSEGLPHRRIYLTGSPMREVLDYYAPKIAKSGIVERLGLDPQRYFVMSAHRQENVDDHDSLRAIIAVLNSIAEHYDYPIVVSTHPRTRQRMREIGFQATDARLRFMDPFGFTDYIQLQRNAKCTISDSGTISEEAAILRFPAITMRNSMERPEAMDCGAIILSGLDKEVVLDCIEAAVQSNSISCTAPVEYAVSDTSWRVLKLILGTTGLSNRWSGIVTPRSGL